MRNRRLSRAPRSVARWIAVGIVAAGMGLLVPSPSHAGDPLSLTLTPFTISDDALRGQPAQFLAGWRLTSPDPRFGGLSGLSLFGDAAFLISDRGAWLRLLLDRDPEGAATGVRDAKIGALRDAAGQPLHGRAADAEALTIGVGGVFWIGFEGGHRIDGFGALGAEVLSSIPALPTAGLARNGGVEALATGAGAALVAIIEEPVADGRDGDDITGWRFAHGQAQRFRIERRSDFAATGADIAPDGALYLLERRYHWLTGVAIRVRRFDAPDYASGDLGAGETVLALGGAAQIDNFEALAVERRADGADVLTLVSDDNFSRWQQTLLAQFVVER